MLSIKPTGAETGDFSVRDQSQRIWDQSLRTKYFWFKVAGDLLITEAHIRTFLVQTRDLSVQHSLGVILLHPPSGLLSP